MFTLFKIEPINYSKFDPSCLRVLESGKIVYEKDGVNIPAFITSPLIKFNWYLSRLTNSYLEISFNQDNDKEKKFYKLLSDIDKMFDKKKDDPYDPIIKQSLDDNPSYDLFLPFYQDKNKKIIADFVFTNNDNVQTEIEVKTSDDVNEYFQHDCYFRFNMLIKSFRKKKNFLGGYNFYSLEIYLGQIEVKTERKELNSIRIREEEIERERDLIGALSNEQDWRYWEFLYASSMDDKIQEKLKAATSAYASASATADESNIAAAKSVLDEATSDAIVSRTIRMETEHLYDVFEEKLQLYNVSFGSPSKWNKVQIWDNKVKIT